MRRARLSRISLHTIITLWVLYCLCIGHSEDHPSSERVSWDNVTEAMHNLAIRKPVTATFSCTRKLSSLLKTPPSDGHQSPMLTLIVLLLSGDIQTWTHSHVATVNCMLVGRRPVSHVTAAIYGFIGLVQTWALVPTTSSQTSVLPGHVTDATASTSPVVDSTHMRLILQNFSIHYPPFLTILLIGASQSRHLLHTLVRPPLVLLPGVIAQQGIRAPNTRDCWAAQLSAQPAPAVLLRDRPAYSRPQKTTCVSL